MDEKERKRQERKERILKQGANRLNKIVNSYSGDGNGDGSVEGIVSEAVSEPASVIEKEDSLEEPVPVENPTETLEEPEKITETTPLIERINPSFVDNDLQLPSLNDPFQDPQPQQPTQKSDLLGWIHAILFTCFTAYFFMVWVRQHSHDLFAMDQVDQNVWYKKSCRQLVHMASHPVHNDLGASSVFHVWGYVMPAWSMFFTFEVVLLSFRFFALQVRYHD
jgi:hypothetical protein